MLLCRSNLANHLFSACTVAKSFSAFSLACLFLQGVFGSVVGQVKNAPFPDLHISSQSTKSVAARLAAQNDLFREQFEDDLRTSPESETARGDYRDNAMLAARE